MGAKAVDNFGWKVGALVFWLGVIFYFSSLPGSGSANFDLLVFLERKGAHVGEYFILNLLALRAFQCKARNLASLCLGASIFSLAYAFSDEIHQLFVFGRTGKLSDVGIDLLGIILAAVIYFLLNKNKTLKR